MSTIIETQSLSLSFGAKQVLNSISVSIPRRHITAIIGPNGSGKTTLLNCISGVNRAYQGQVSLNDQNLNNINQRQVAAQLAYLHQHMPSNLHLSVRQVVELGLTPSLNPWSGLTEMHHQRVERALLKVSMNGFEERSFDTLSGGEKQRVLIAKVIVQNPDILLLDEPTNHLDIKYQIDIMKLITSLKMTVVCCIHDLNLAAAFADHIICLNEGNVAFQGAKDDVLTSDNISSVYGVNTVIDSNPLNNAARISFDCRGSR